MKTLLLCLAIGLALPFSVFSQNKSLGVGTTTPNPNAALHVESPTNNQGFIIPRLTTAQRSSFTGALTTTDVGLIVFDTDLRALTIWNGSTWDIGMKAGEPITANNAASTGHAGLFENTNASNSNAVILINNAGTGNAISANGNVQATSFAGDGANLTNITASAVSINTVGTSTIIDNEISNADINATAAIAGSKINPDFGAQNIVTTGAITGAFFSGDGSALTNMVTDSLSANAVKSISISDGSILNADISNTAAIAGNKINPDFGAQNIVTTGAITGASFSGDGSALTNMVADSLSANAVKSISISDGSILNADISNTATIAGSKINPDFGAQNIVTTGAITGASFSGDGSALANIIADSVRMNGVTGNAIVDFTIENKDISTTTSIFGTKILPDFGAQSIFTTGSVNAATVNVNGLPYAWPGTQTTGILNNDGAGNLTWAPAGGTGDLLAANNLSELTNTTTARTNLGLGPLAELNNVGSAEISDQSITDADISNSAAIAGSKINPDFGAQTIATTGSVTAASFSGDGSGLTNVVANGWGLTGNGSTTPGTDFIGTSDAQDLVFKTNNTEAVRILSSGQVGIGSTPISAKLDVSSANTTIGVHAASSAPSGVQNRGLQADASGSTAQNIGVYGTGFIDGSNGAIGVYGEAIGNGTSDAIGLYGVTNNFTATTGKTYGVYASAENGSVNWAGYFNSGNVHIKNALSVGLTDGTFGTTGHILTSQGNSAAPAWLPLLPYTLSTSDAGTLFSLTNTNTGTGSGALFENTNGTNTGNALTATSGSSGGGLALSVNASGVSTAMRINATNAGNTQPALNIVHSGSGNAITANRPIQATSFIGDGSALTGISGLTLPYTQSTAAGTTAFDITNSGTAGYAGSFANTNASNTDNALFVSVAGNGNAIRALSTGGPAAYLQILNPASSYDALVVTTNGTGPTLNLQSTNGSNSNPALNITHGGTGNAITANRPIQATSFIGDGSLLTGISGGFNLPYANTMSSASPLFELTNSNGTTATFWNSGSGAAAEFRSASGTSPVVYGLSETSREVALFQATSPISTFPAVEIESYGNAPALLVNKENNNGAAQFNTLSGSNNTPTVQITNTGLAAALSATADGDGSTASFTINNNFNTNQIASFSSNGTGRGIQINLTDAGNTQAAIEINHAGTGNAIAANAPIQATGFNAPSGTGSFYSISTGAGGASIGGDVTASAFYGDGSGLTNLPSGLNLPYSSTQPGASPLFQITNSTDGGAASFQTNGTGGSAGVFSNTNSLNGSAAVSVSSAGSLSLDVSGASTLYAGSTTAITLTADNSYGGQAANFYSGGGSDPTVYIYNDGTGPGIRSLSPLDIPSNSTTTPALSIATSTTAVPAMVVDQSGTGAALQGNHSANGLALLLQAGGLRIPTATLAGGGVIATRAIAYRLNAPSEPTNYTFPGGYLQEGDTFFFYNDGPNTAQIEGNSIPVNTGVIMVYVGGQIRFYGN